MTVKKSATKKHTAAKIAAEETTKRGGSSSFPEAYIRFRTVLDSMEAMALRYCLKDADPEKRVKRAKEIEKDLMPVIKKYQEKLETVNIPGDRCPDGFINCGGCCVPYQCP
jgi:hypothetical protein